MHAYATVRSAVQPHEYSVEYGPAPKQIAELFLEPVLPRAASSCYRTGRALA